MKTEWKDKYVEYERLKAMIRALSETRADKKVHEAVLGKSAPKEGEEGRKKKGTCKWFANWSSDTLGKKSCRQTLFG